MSSLDFIKEEIAKLYCEWFAEWLNQGAQCDILLLDFSKAIDMQSFALTAMSQANTLWITRPSSFLAKIISESYIDYSTG